MITLFLMIRMEFKEPVRKAEKEILVAETGDFAFFWTIELIL